MHCLWNIVCLVKFHCDRCFSTSSPCSIWYNSSSQGKYFFNIHHVDHPRDDNLANCNNVKAELLCIMIHWRCSVDNWMDILLFLIYFDRVLLQPVQYSLQHVMNTKMSHNEGKQMRKVDIFLNLKSNNTSTDLACLQQASALTCGHGQLAALTVNIVHSLCHARRAL